MADSFIWYELMTTDADAAVGFYGKLVGWTAADHPNSTTPGGMRYSILSAGERGVGGVMQLDADMTKAGMRPIWVGYIGVADADATAERIKATGGTIHVPPTDIPDVGRFAMASDPGGALFYVMTPLPREDMPAADPNAPGTVSWREHYSSVGEKAAFAFYSGLFGWETMHEMPMGEMGTYRLFGADGVQMGGMMDKPANVPASIWGYYVNVDGIDAAAERVKAAGGQVLMGPMEVPGGSWIVQCVDPQGAAFALVSAGR